MILHILGSSGTYPVLGRPASGYIVEENGTKILCDLGSGTFDVLLRDHSPEDLDAVIVSHRHADHCSDVLALYHYLAYGLGIKKRLPLYAPSDTLEALVGFSASESGFANAFETRIADGTTSIGGIDISFTPANHSVPAVVSRLSGEHRSLAYTGDTGVGGGWEESVRGVDLLLSEASLQGDEPAWQFHLTAADAGRIARRMEVGRLVLTHIPPHLDSTRSIEQAEATFDRPVALAVTGGTIEL